MKKSITAFFLLFFISGLKAEITTIITEPSGSSGQVQYNNNGEFGGDSDFTFNGTTVTASRASISTATVGNLTLTGGAGAGKIPVSDASGVLTLTEPTSLSVATATYSLTSTSSTYSSTSSTATYAITAATATNVSGIVPTLYGGTGKDWSNINPGHIPYFSSTGTMSVIDPGISGSVLISSGPIPCFTDHLRLTSSDSESIGDLSFYGIAPTFHGYAYEDYLYSATPYPANKMLLGIGGRPWTGSAFTAHSAAAIHMVSRETISETNQGALLSLIITPLGNDTNNRLTALTMQADHNEGVRLKSDFSAGSHILRTLFQTSVAGGGTTVGAIPSSTGTFSQFVAWNGVDPGNSAYTMIKADESKSYLTASATGSGTPLPLQIQVAGSDAVYVSTTGHVGIGTTSPGLVETSGRKYLTIKGSGTTNATGSGVLQMTSNAAYTTTPNLGNIEWHVSDNSSSSSTRAAYISSAVDGATANNVGASLTFATKENGVSGSGTSRFSIAGNGYIDAPGVYSETSASAANVFVDTDGSLRRSTSSKKYKTSIKAYMRGLDFVLKLRPVTYVGKNDAKKTAHAGLIAEDVDAAGLKEFVVYGPDGKPDALEYQNMIVLLVNTIKEMDARIKKLESK